MNIKSSGYVYLRGGVYLKFLLQAIVQLQLVTETLEIFSFSGNIKTENTFGQHH